METLALIILIICSVLGFGAIFFTTFGTLIILIGSFLYAFMTDLSVLNIQSLVVLTILYLIGEVLESVFTIIGAKRLGASNLAIAGAFIGGTAGAMLGTIYFHIDLFLSTMLGVFLGAFIIELILKRNLAKSAKAAFGGVVGRILSIVAKAAIALAMFFVIYHYFSKNSPQTNFTVVLFR